MSKGICVIIPAYNEAQVIGDVLDNVPRSIKVGKKTFPITIVVVNDGSADETHEVVLARRHVVLVNHILNSGAGGATRTGLRYAKDHKFDYALTMDADGQHEIGDVVKVAKAIIKDDEDFIIGSRLIDTTGMPRHRVLGNRGLNVISFILFGIKVSDVQSGLRAFNKKALHTIKFHSSNFAFCPEMIWSAKLQKLRIAEVPIKAIYTDYSLGKGQLGQSDITAGVRVVRQLVKQRLMGFFDG
jgi:glycosyltransferase involved in cell wall biosynthesis